ncbi:MAG: hypothetical protein J6B89_04650 [Bacilli bacterium]|nr:hypothetical protein [Bacilli bacterium]
MTLEEARLSNGWSLEEASKLYGLDVETVINCEANTKNSYDWAINIILSVLELDYKDVVWN